MIPLLVALLFGAAPLAPAQEAPVAPDHVAAAITQGLQALRHLQTPEGRFRAHRCSGTAWTTCEPEQTDFYASLIVDALRPLPPVTTAHLTQPAQAVLAQDMEAGGWWRFYAAPDPFHAAFGPDLDDTACAASALHASAHALPARHVEDLMAHRDADGLFWTWRPDAAREGHAEYLVMRAPQAPAARVIGLNDIDCAVNANVLFYLARAGRRVPEVEQYLAAQVAGEALPACSLYYTSAPFIGYLLARAHAAGAAGLGPALPALQARLAQAQLADGSWGTALDTASAMIVLAAPGAAARPALERGAAWLLKNQQLDGSWAWAEVIHPGRGSSALTTALCLEALARFQQLPAQVAHERD